jgi:hypothetical protein
MDPFRALEEANRLLQANSLALASNPWPRRRLRQRIALRAAQAAALSAYAAAVVAEAEATGPRGTLLPDRT